MAEDDLIQEESSAENKEPFVDTSTEKEEKKDEISARDAYFFFLDSWVKEANISQNAMALFPWYLMNSYPQMFQNNGNNGPPGWNVGTQNTQQNLGNANNNGNGAADRNTRFGMLRLMDEQAQAEVINQNGGYEYSISAFWKRAVAELIDIIILLFLKLIVTFIIVNLFDLEFLGLDFDKEVLQKAMTDEDITGFISVSLDFLAFSSDLLILELVTKITVCFYEAFWTTYYNGATPGKAIMNIRILYVDAVLPLNPGQLPQVGLQINRNPVRALIYPGETPNFYRSLLRALAKNLIMSLLFPMCFIMIFFKYNRTVYDILTKTVVVDNNPAPVLRRRR